MRVLLIAIFACLYCSADPVEIWISSAQDKVYYENMVKLYQEKVDAKFEGEIKAYGFREMPDKLAVAMKTGVGTPDIVQLDEVFFGMYLGSPKIPFLDLTDRVKKAGLDKNLHPNRLGLFSFKDKVYGLPQSLSAMVLWYSKEAFEEWDIKPEDIDTWEKFVEVGKDLAKENQSMLALDWSYFEILLRQRGTDLFDKDGNPFPDRKLAEETLGFLQGLQKKGVGLMPDRGSIFDPVFFSGDIANGEVMAVIGADWYGLDMIQQFAPDMAGQWGVMPLPTWDDKAKRKTSTFAGQGLMIYGETKKADKAWDFIKFVISDKDANAKRFLDGNSFPAWKPAWNDKRLMDKHEFFDVALGKMFKDLAGDVPKVVMHPKRPQAVFMLRETYFSSVMYETQTPAEALKELSDMLNRGGGGPR